MPSGSSWVKSAMLAAAVERCLRAAVICLMALAGALPAAALPRCGQDKDTIAETHRLEGEAVLALADAALEGRAVPSDFSLRWHHEFLKAQRGTFIPFTLTIDAARFTRAAALVYVRAVKRDDETRRDRGRPFGARGARPRDPATPEEFAVDAIFPVDLARSAGRPARVSRGFTLPAGNYLVYVVVRERVAAPGVAPVTPPTGPLAAVLRQPLVVPDFAVPGLTTSTVLLGERLDVLPEPIAADALPERPYAIGRNELTPAVDRVFRRTQELVVLLLIYNPFVTTEGTFDLQVEYHFFKKGTGDGPDGVRSPGSHPPANPGERYFNRTDAQRFTPDVLGASFDPAAGHPVLAGQGVPLSGFAEGEYRLVIRIVDALGASSITRDVHFTVGS